MISSYVRMIGFPAFTISAVRQYIFIMKGESSMKQPIEVPVWEKSNLTIEEAAQYSNIGQNKLRELTESEDCKFVLWVGTKRLIKRKLFDEYIEKAYSI